MENQTIVGGGKRKNKGQMGFFSLVVAYLLQVIMEKLVVVSYNFL